MEFAYVSIVEEIIVVGAKYCRRNFNRRSQSLRSIDNMFSIPGEYTICGITAALDPRSIDTSILARNTEVY